MHTPCTHLQCDGIAMAEGTQNTEPFNVTDALPLAPQARSRAKVLANDGSGGTAMYIAEKPVYIEQLVQRSLAAMFSM